MASITELKKNPMGTAQAGSGDVMAILNRNEPAFYCVPAGRYEAMLDLIDDLKLVQEVQARLAANEPRIPAKIVNGDLLFKGEPGFDETSKYQQEFDRAAQKAWKKLDAETRGQLVTFESQLPAAPTQTVDRDHARAITLECR